MKTKTGIDENFIALSLSSEIGFIQETCQECFGEAYALMQLKSVVINGKKEVYN